MKRCLSTMICSSSYTLCINDEGAVSSFGTSNNGAHGFAEENVFPPKIIPTLRNITSIATRSDYSVCLYDDGNVFTFGSNEYGNLE